jgi:5-methylcytosine-specific restriction endonuclease McrA
MTEPKIGDLVDADGFAVVGGQRIDVLTALTGGDGVKSRQPAKECPRGIVSVGELRCGGVGVAGVRFVSQHMAPAEEFGHDGGHCEEGRAWCRQHKCAECHSASSRLRRAIRRAPRTHLSDEDLRAATPTKRCPGCGVAKTSGEFGVGRSERDGLNSRCRPCNSASVLATRTRKTVYRAKAKRHAAKKNLPFFDFNPTDIYTKHNGLCHLCNEPCTEKLETRRGYDIEHLIPIQVDPSHLAVYGIDHPGHVPWNAAIAHPSCNNSKGNRLNPSDVALYLKQLGEAPWRDLAAVRVPEVEETNTPKEH